MSPMCVVQQYAGSFTPKTANIEWVSIVVSCLLGAMYHQTDPFPATSSQDFPRAFLGFFICASGILEVNYEFWESAFPKDTSVVGFLILLFRPQCMILS